MVELVTDASTSVKALMGMLANKNVCCSHDPDVSVVYRTVLNM